MEPIAPSAGGSFAGVLVLDAESAAQKPLKKLDIHSFSVGMYEAAGKATCFYKLHLMLHFINALQML